MSSVQRAGDQSAKASTAFDAIGAKMVYATKGVVCANARFLSGASRGNRAALDLFRIQHPANFDPAHLPGAAGPVSCARSQQPKLS
jgi:hypothetical protein